MNQDFTVKKKSNICLKKNSCRGVQLKKNSCTSSERKKKWRKLKIPPLRSLVPCEERGESTFYPELFFFLHGTKEETTAVFIQILGLAVDCG